MTALYAIGDIHGQLAEMIQAIEWIEKDGGPEAPIVFLGDYTDRGPDSRGVLDFLIQGRDAGRHWTSLKGNHDRMFEWFLQTPSRADPHLFTDLSWLHERLGGQNTLRSYGLDFSTRRRLSAVHDEALRAVPKAHREFLERCPLTFETEDLFFCHAGIRPGVALCDQDEEDLLWIREEFLDFDARHPKLIVHGHSPIERACHYGNRVNLDSGAGYGHPLTAAVFEELSCSILTAQGRRKISMAA
ncbi:metallophosphoesterase family protein [Planktomarina sp.]|uniref:metallophosphoesterase family protein n=1 Tax=Planktomarina sp. TaxID=2024851 RepID=UPI002890A8A9|nr:metallophosphoesterase family protein [Planktomarina sp.]